MVKRKFPPSIKNLLIGISSAILFTAGCSGKVEKSVTPAHPAVTLQEFIYSQASAPTPECHASSIAETNGMLVAAWFGGTKEKNVDVGIWLSRREGQNWTAAVEVANGVQDDGSRHPCWNPVLFQASDGPLMLFYKVGPDPESWWGMLVTSEDGGKTWSAPRRLPEGFAGPIKNKPMELTDGTVLCPSSREDAGWTVHLEITDKAAENWQNTGALNDPEKFGAIQPTILIYPENKLQMLCRTENSLITQLWSSDNGQTWSEMTPTSLPNPNSGIDGLSLSDGRQLLVYNPTGDNWGDRVPLSIALSSDGQTWKKMLDLESVTDPETADEEEYSYPAVIQAADGQVHILYTYNRLTIKHVVVDPAKL